MPVGHIATALELGNAAEIHIELRKHAAFVPFLLAEKLGRKAWLFERRAPLPRVLARCYN